LELSSLRISVLGHNYQLPRGLAYGFCGAVIWILQGVNVASIPNGVDSAHYTGYMSLGQDMNRFFPPEYNYTWTRSTPIILGLALQDLLGPQNGYIVARFLIVMLLASLIGLRIYKATKSDLSAIYSLSIVVGLPTAAYVVTNDYVYFTAWPLYVLGLVMMSDIDFSEPNKIVVLRGIAIGIVLALLFLSYPGPVPLFTIALASAVFVALRKKLSVKSLAIFGIALSTSTALSAWLVSVLAKMTYGAEDIFQNVISWSLYVTQSNEISDYFHTDGFFWLRNATSLGAIVLVLVITWTITYRIPNTLVSKELLFIRLTLMLQISYLGFQQFSVGLGVLENINSVSFLLATATVTMLFLHYREFVSYQALVILLLVVLLVPHLPRLIFPLWPNGIALISIATFVVTSINFYLKNKYSGAIQSSIIVLCFSVLMFGHTTEIMPGAANVAGPNYKVGYLDSTYAIDRLSGIQTIESLLTDDLESGRTFTWLAPNPTEQSIQVAATFIWGNAEYSLRGGTLTPNLVDYDRVSSREGNVYVILVGLDKETLDRVKRQMQVLNINVLNHKCVLIDKTHTCRIDVRA
jgi:hypothetical protein